MESILSYNKASSILKESTYILDRIANKELTKLPVSKKSTRIIVTIPANNEEKLIIDCLEALRNQQILKGNLFDYNLFEVIVLCHNCSDKTLSFCKNYLIIYPEFNLLLLDIYQDDVDNVGAARRILMNIASNRLKDPDGIIATTDADTIANKYWLANLLGYYQSEYDLICGKINVLNHYNLGRAQQLLNKKESYGNLRATLEAVIAPDILDPLPRHFHNSGPNLAIKKKVYDSIGGMPPISFLEDIALYDLVASSGKVIRHCPFTIVSTSNRTVARVAQGFSSQLSDWNTIENKILYVEGLNKLIRKFKIFDYIRTKFYIPTNLFLEKLCDLTGIEITILQQMRNASYNPNALINRIDRALDTSENWNTTYPNSDIDLAIMEIDNYLKSTNLFAIY